MSLNLPTKKNKCMGNYSYYISQETTENPDIPGKDHFSLWNKGHHYNINAKCGINSTGMSSMNLTASRMAQDNSKK
jgi:hypothetical protein